ncbi:MAG: hypothetical protein ABIJ59_04355 [Pseudomonadota bacterium]
MKALVKWVLFIFFIGLLVLPVVGFVLSIQKTPKVTQHEVQSFDNVKRVKELVDKSRPAHMRKRQIQVFQMNEQDLNLLVSYALSQGLKPDTVYSKIRLLENAIKADITIVIPSTPLGEYINISLDVKSAGTTLSVVSLQIGRLFIYGRIINPVLNFLHKYLLKIQVYQNLMENTDAIQQISIKNNLLKIIYQWDPDSLAKLQESSKTILLPMDHQKRLIFYNNELTDILKPYKRQNVSLAHVIAPMFQRALEQLKISNDPVQENRALLQTLALYSNGTSLAHFISQDLQKTINSPIKSFLVLNGKKDLPKHFLVSAGLSVSAGSSLANFIGLAKEVEDSDGGTGFSFADLAAGKAGVKLGQLAVASKQTAQRLQLKMSSIKKEADFMPDIDQLSEGLMTLAFKKKYTDLDSKAYSLVNDEIDRRISQCSVYQWP